MVPCSSSTMCRLRGPFCTTLIVPPHFPLLLLPSRGLTLLLAHALSPADVTVPSDSWPSMEACLLRVSALSLPLMSLCPLTQDIIVSSCWFSRVSGAFWILASMCDFGPWVPESRFSVVLITGLQSERIASRPVWHGSLGTTTWELTSVKRESV